MPKPTTHEEKFAALCERIRGRGEVLAQSEDVVAARSVFEEIRGSGTDTVSVEQFVGAVAERAHLSGRTIYRYLAIGTGLSDHSKKRLRGTPLASQTRTLEALADVPHERQAAAIEVYLSRRGKSEKGAQSALMSLLRPVDAAPPPEPKWAVEIDEPIPIDGSSFHASFLGHLVTCVVAEGRLRVIAVGPDASATHRRWPKDPAKVMVGGNNWTAAVHHAVETLDADRRRRVRLGAVEVVPPVYCPRCGESRRWIHRAGVPLELAAAKRLARHDVVRIEIGECIACTPRSKEDATLLRDFGVKRHRLRMMLDVGPGERLVVTATIWPSHYAAGWGYVPDRTQLVVFESDDHVLRQFACGGAGDPVFNSLAFLSFETKTLLSALLPETGEGEHVGLASEQNGPLA